MYDDGVTDDVERTAFRREEKKYKLYYDQNARKKKEPRPVDLSEVVDFKSILDTYNHTGKTSDGVQVKFGGDFDGRVFCLDNRPGFYFVPGALSVEEQCQWIRESLTRFPQPPNRSNHNAFYCPIQDLFIAAEEGKALVEVDHSPTELQIPSKGHAQRWKFCDETNVSLKGSGGTSILASVLLRKLRWSTLGLQFDWSKRNYDVSLPHKIPDELCQLTKRLAAPAMPIGEEFKPEAAIVNYFGSGDTLGGHLDDMEVDWSKPIVSMRLYVGGHLDDMEVDWSKLIVSMSLGCKAIFLLGGKCRNDEPLAMFLRSGDVVLMSGEVRECFHGISHRNFAAPPEAVVVAAAAREKSLPLPPRRSCRRQSWYFLLFLVVYPSSSLPQSWWWACGSEIWWLWVAVGLWW